MKRWKDQKGFHALLAALKANLPLPEFRKIDENDLRKSHLHLRSVNVLSFKVWWASNKKWSVESHQSKGGYLKIEHLRWLLLLFHSPESSWNKFIKIKHFQYCTQYRAITSTHKIEMQNHISIPVSSLSISTLIIFHSLRKAIT